MTKIRWMVRGAIGMGVATMATVAGCMGGGGDGEAIGSAQVAITQVPTDGTVGCIKVTATGAFAVATKSTDVTPGSSSVLNLHSLPTGTVSFTGNAYAGACALVSSASVPTWISDPVIATVSQVPVVVTLAMKRNGQATVGVDFPDASCRTAGEPCLAGTECCSSVCTGNACQAACTTNGAACTTNAACCSGLCNAGTCVAPTPTCTDGIQNGAETDVDCGGGTCPACPVGKKCATDPDCASNACDVVTFTCVANQCTDHQKDSYETDVDCGGGTCPACPVGKACVIDADCTSNACDPVTATCAASQCTDQQRDGAETDVDCGGGTCPVCSVGKQCVVDTDCASNACDALTLLCDANQCIDHRKDGVETDVDCGGSTCPACAVGKQCVVDTDCTSNACDALTLTCVASQCTDHRQDGAETDVDCGGSVCPSCAVGKKCNVNADCQAGHVCNTSHICQ